MPGITREEVERIAALARLALEPGEAGRMAGELDAILDYVKALAAVDTRDVAPTSHVLDLATPLREDRAEPPLDPELALANAPERDGTAFLVPKVIEADEEG
jgi:aspartyl-tRNA(Asn)/glutamyl-tRNA(Gln) amidotransferase subunit C